MGTEPFLINPLPRKIRRIPKFKLKRYRKMVRKRLADAEFKRRGILRNPLGGELMILGLNPKRKRRSKISRRLSLMNPRRRRRARKAKHNARRRRGMRLHDNRRRRRLSANPRRRRRSYRMNDNPKHKRRRTRRNPVRRGFRGNPALSIAGIKHILPLAVTGGASIIATGLVPSLIGMQSQWTRYGAQAATALIGGYAVDKFAGREHGLVWAVSGVAVIVADVLQRYVVSRVLPVAPAGVSGIGYMDEGNYMDAFPSGMDAYPGEMAGFDAYPYSGVAPSY